MVKMSQMMMLMIIVL